jgi:hypothetical protein
MALPIPNLDDRSFNDLLQEAKSLIPIYNKEWTNHNPSDPGITLLELFSWLSEMIIYRLNQVPEANYRAFLKLLGIDYVFRWDGIPGIDSTRLGDFLSQNYGIVWLPPVKTEKSADEQTILISDVKNTISLRLNNEGNKVTIGFNTGKNDELEAVSECLFIWNNIPGADESKLLGFTHEIFDMALTAQISKNADDSGIFVIDGGKTISLTLNQSRDHVSIVSYSGNKLQLKVFKERDQLKVTRQKIFQPIAKDIQRGLTLLNQRYRAITADDFEALTLEYLRQLQPDLTGRVIGMMNRDLEYSKSNPDMDKPGHITLMLLVSGEKPVCCWEDIPGPDNIQLIDFLTRVYDINWLATAEITKSPDEKQIIITKTDHSAVVLLDKIGDDRVSLNCPGFLTDELLVKEEKLNGKIKSYLYAYGMGDAKPSVLLRRQVKQFLSRRKLVTTRVHVVAPNYYHLNLKAQIVVSSNTNAANVLQLAETTVRKYLSPLEGGESGNGWPVGRYIYRSEIYQLLERVPGVDHVAGLTLDGNDFNQAAVQPQQLIDPQSDISITEVPS